MFAPITYRFRAVCSWCGGSIQPGARGERDNRRKLNHCPACTRSRAAHKQERVLNALKIG